MPCYSQQASLDRREVDWTRVRATRRGRAHLRSRATNVGRGAAATEDQCFASTVHSPRCGCLTLSGIALLKKRPSACTDRFQRSRTHFGSRADHDTACSQSLRRESAGWRILGRVVLGIPLLFRANSSGAMNRTTTRLRLTRHCHVMSLCVLLLMSTTFNIMQSLRRRWRYIPCLRNKAHVILGNPTCRCPN